MYSLLLLRADPKHRCFHLRNDFQRRLSLMVNMFATSWRSTGISQLPWWLFSILDFPATSSQN